MISNPCKYRLTSSFVCGRALSNYIQVAFPHLRRMMLMVFCFSKPTNSNFQERKIIQRHFCRKKNVIRRNADRPLVQAGFHFEAQDYDAKLDGLNNLINLPHYFGFKSVLLENPIGLNYQVLSGELNRITSLLDYPPKRRTRAASNGLHLNSSAISLLKGNILSTMGIPQQCFL